MVLIQVSTLSCEMRKLISNTLQSLNISYSKKIRLFAYYMICCGLILSVIRKFPITEFFFAKRKINNSTINLTLMTFIIYKGNKVKSNRGEEKK